MQLPTISSFLLFLFVSPIFSSPLGQDKVQVTIQLSSGSPSSPDKPDLSPVAPLSWGYVGQGTYRIVSLVDDYAIVPTEFYTVGHTDLVLKYGFGCPFYNALSFVLRRIRDSPSNH